MNQSDIKILKCTYVGDTITNNFYSLYYPYQQELRIIDNGITEPIETETECIVHVDNYQGYTDNVITYNDKEIGIISHQNIDWLDDGQAPLLYIDHLYIKPEYRHQGIATCAMMDLINKYSKHTIYLYVLKKNKSAKQFWHKLVETANNPKLIYANDERCMVRDETEALRTCKKIIFKKGNNE